MPLGFLAHGTWIDDLAVPLVVAAVFSAGVLRASAGEPGDDDACPYCGAPGADRLVGTSTAGATPVVRCGRCGFRLGTRLSASEAGPPAPGEGSR